MKECTNCDIEKPKDQFYKHNSSKDGLSYKCRECYKEYQRKRYDPVDSSEVECGNCGNVFETKGNKKYCSSDCYKEVQKKRKRESYHKNKGKIEYTCKGCGETAYATAKHRTTYCSHECYLENRCHDWKIADVGKAKRECVTCGDKYEGWTSSRYCSDECNPNNWQRCNVIFKNCSYCGDLFTSQHHTQEYCSSTCANDYKCECLNCGDEFDRSDGEYFNYCSDDCRNEYKRKVRRSSEDHYARARKFNTYKEKVNRIKVFERDKYICQDCGIKTDAELVGKNTNKNNEPTLDHVIPMSLGGPHSYSNVQTLCRSCNVEKSNHYEGQLALV